MTLAELESRSLNVNTLSQDQLNRLLSPEKIPEAEKESPIINEIDISVNQEPNEKESQDELIADKEIQPKEEPSVVIPEDITPEEIISEVKPWEEVTPEKEEPEKEIPIEEPPEEEPVIEEPPVVKEETPEEKPVEIPKIEIEEPEKPPEIPLKEDVQVIEKKEPPRKLEKEEPVKPIKKAEPVKPKIIIDEQKEQAKKEAQKQIEQKKRKKIVQKSKLLLKSWNLDLAKQRSKTDQPTNRPKKTWKGLSTVKTIVSANKKIFAKTRLRGKWKNPTMSPVLLRKYLPIVNEAIKPYWHVPVELDPTLQVLIKALVAKDGRIISIEPVETSGSQLFDQAVKKIFVELVQLPPLPEAFPGEFTEIALRFKSSQ